MIHSFKFNGRRPFGKVLGQIAGAQLAQQLGHTTPDWLVPIPLHPERLKQRGFNQALLIAQQISSATGIPVLSTLCRRTENTATQSTLPKSKRSDNVTGAFSLVQPQLDRVLQQAPHPHIAIVDDVITTGATIQALTQLLLEAGVHRVDCWSISRALL